MFEVPLSPEKLDALLVSLRSGLDSLLGDQLEAVYLYGSQARGEARPDSDIDVLVVIKENFDYGQMLDRTSDLAWNLSLENDLVVSLAFVSKTQYDRNDTPFLWNVHREAILVGNS